MKDIYTYPAVFGYAPDGISIKFPDFPGCLSCADDNSEALYMARDALAGRIYIHAKQNLPLPEPTDILAVAHEGNQAVVLVDVNMKNYTARQENTKNINKMCTVPEWLVQEADEAGINYSRTLQDALMDKLGIKRPSSRKRKH